MAFTKITDADLQGKGVVGQAPVPGLPVKEMQESVEQIVREVAIPGINRLADELSAQTAAKNIGMQVPDGMPGGASANVSSIVATHVLAKGNPHNVTAEQVGAYTKEQTDQAISQKVQDIGAGDMSKAEYAPTGTYGAVDRALSADNASQSDDGVKVYTHTKSGTVHNFAGSGANGRAKLTADVQAGDTFTVNGVPVTAYMGADSAVDAMAGSPWNGKWVSFIVEGGTLNFSAAAKATAIALSGVFQDSLASPATGYSQVSIPVAGTWPELVESESISTKVEPADKYNYRRVSFEVKRAGRYVVSISAGTLSSTYTTIVDAKLVDSDGKTVAKADPSGYLYTHGYAVCDLRAGMYQLQVNRTSSSSAFCAITISR